MKFSGIPQIALFAVTGLVAAQTPAPNPAPAAAAPQSLAEFAREYRAATSATPKARRTFTNDTMPHHSTMSVVGPGEVPVESTESTDKPAGTAAADKGTAKEKKTDQASAGEEAAVRARFAGLRQNLETEQRRLDVLQREFNLAQLQSYSDPNQAMREQFARTEIQKRQAEIDDQKQVVAAAQKALDDALEDARQKGVPAGWTAPAPKQ
jgi:hypothetical protein